MPTQTKTDRRLYTLTFVVFAVAFHKYTHEAWRLMLEQLGFSHGLLGSRDWLDNFRTASERALNEWLALFYLQDDLHVTNRLIQNQSNGIFSAGISLNLDGSYQSVIGLPSWLATLPATFLDLTGTAARFSIYSIAAVVNAAVASSIVYITKRHLHKGAALVVMFSLLQPWVLIFAATPFLIFGIRLLPSLWLAHALKRNLSSTWSVAFIPLALTVFAMSSGYAWITNLAVMPLAVIVYFSVSQSWTLSRTARSMITSSCVTLLALITTLGLHVLQLGLRFGSIAEGWRQISNSLGKRSGSDLSAVTDPLVLEALASSPRLVLDWYLAMPVFMSPARLPVIGYFTVLVLISACMVIVLDDSFCRIPTAAIVERRALGMAWVISLLGPICWILLFRPSAYIHTHIDGAIWYFPSIPLGLLILFQKTKEVFRSPRRGVRFDVVLFALVLLGATGAYLVSLWLQT